MDRDGDRRAVPPCYHGGASFEAIGVRFDDLARRHATINADVLDAWFDPAPGVAAALVEHLPWLLRTSPPTGAEGLVAEIAAARGVPPEALVVGAGSSDLIFRALGPGAGLGLGPGSRVLLLEPTYGEYAHVLEGLGGLRVERLPLRRADGFALSPGRLAEALGRGYDLAVLVNPNNPTGGHLPRRVLEPLLADAPRQTRIWVDEAYVDYAGPGESLEGFAWRRPNVLVCKSLSKAYALSGARAGYLCCDPALAGALRPLIPPWAVGLLAQVAAVAALRDPAYYAERYRLTHALRDDLAAGLRRALGAVEIITGVLNAVLCLLPEAGPEAAAVAAACRRRGLFVRDLAATCPSLGRHALRVAVKPAETQARMIAILAEAVGC